MSETFKVYAAEIDDGLEDLLCSSNSFVAGTLARIEPLIDPAVFEGESRKKDIEFAEETLGLSRQDIDLHPVYTILVTTGWNKNDDIFDGQETWDARSSPVDKPFNLEHEPSKIIGHITNSAGVDESYKVIQDGSKLPDKFHILTRSVIYKHVTSRNPEWQEEVAKLIEGIARNEWFVSMEALFTNFDYGLVSPDGNQQVVARQENTAFLTKHLRIFGGTGEYGGRRLGRVLRNITFSGKGLVRNPANPDSIIFNDTDMFKGVLANEHETKVLISGADNMSDEILRELKDKNAALEQKLSEALHKLEEMGEAAVQAKLDAKDKSITELKDNVATLTKSIEELTASVKELEKSRDEAVAAKIEIQEKLTKAEEAIEASKAETLKTSRISMLVDKGVDKAEAEELVAEFSDLDDGKFNKLVELKSELAAKKKCSDEDEEDDKKSKASEEEEETEETDDSTEAETDETLSDAEEEKDAALASEDTDDDASDLHESIASYLGSYLGSREQN